MTGTRAARAVDLGRDWTDRRTLASGALSALTYGLAAIALVPLISVLVMLVTKGVARLDATGLTDLPPAPRETGGGLGSAIHGTIVMVTIASLVAVPVGVISAIFLTEIAPESRLSSAVRFCAKVLTGLPSIIAGVVAFATIVLWFGHPSAWAGGVALSLLMIPIVLLTAEEGLKSVPAKQKQAAIGLGATPFQVVTRVTLPTARRTIATGVMLSVARASGETAPLLFTAQFSWFGLRPPYNEETPSLAYLIYEFSNSFDRNQIDLAWTGSLVLVTLVLALNLTGQHFLRNRARRS